MTSPATSDKNSGTGVKSRDGPVEAVRFPCRTSRLTRPKAWRGIWTTDVFHPIIFAIYKKAMSKVASVISVEFETPEEVAGFTKYVAEKQVDFSKDLEQLTAVRTGDTS
ncbi:MAG: hypothetical protein VX178_08990, partial [Pseudomonadota bacterium]|nr:hypothetical protein [Pseudomonadota bacterium]